MPTIKPLDEDAVLELAETSRLIVTAEEHSIIGGLGGAVSEVVSEKHPVLVRRVGTRDTFGCSGTPQELLNFFGLTAAGIVETAKQAVKW